MTNDLEDRIKEILALEADWDSYGAKPILPKTVDTARHYIGVITELAKEWGLQLSNPNLCGCADGSLDLNWGHTKDPKTQKQSEFYLLVNVPEAEDKKPTYYGWYNGKELKGKLK